MPVLTNKGCFKIGNNEYVAQAIKPIFESLADENSGRVESGQMIIHFVRTKMRKWEITMPPMTSDELCKLLNDVQGKVYTITIWDVSAKDANQDLNGDYVSVQVYTSNSNADMYSGVLYNGLWRNVKFSAIEM